MKLKGILPFARSLMDLYTSEESITVDATCGNGNDTLYLAQMTPNGHVYAFDIQEQAILNTKERTKHLSNITYVHKGHEHIQDYVTQPIDCAIFNLGYLPKGDKAVVTKPETTIAAIKQLLTLAKAGAGIILVIYPGHDEGKVEKDAVLTFIQSIDQNNAHILKYEFINQKNNPPFICVIEKR